MGEIIYMEKPDWISWKDVQECIYLSHQTNKKKGFEMLNSNISAKELEENLKDGHCFVALDDSKVVGTASSLIKKVGKWWTLDKVLYHCYDGILPSYRGTDVYLELGKLRKMYDEKSGVKICQFHTAESNKTVIRINLKKGYKLVQFAPTGKGANYYSVTMVKWDDGCPFPEWFVKFMFILSRFVSKTFLTPEYKFKFWFK